MTRKRSRPEQIINLLHEVEVGPSQGRKIGEICRSLGFSEQSYYLWRSGYGGMKLERVKRLKVLGNSASALESWILQYFKCLSVGNSVCSDKHDLRPDPRPSLTLLHLE